MKSYAEYLRDLIGKKGSLDDFDQGCYFFRIDIGNTDTLIEVGQDYAKFLVMAGGVREHRLVPLNMLSVWI